ncbi:hypothetical protein VTO73DRAFT_7067 [Trametes versicolor]
MVPLARAEMPTEVYEGIIDALWPDCGSLAQCALTCRAWLPRSRYNLYRRTTLRSQAQLSSFSQTLHNSPVGSEPRPADIVEELILWPMVLNSFMTLGRAIVALPKLSSLDLSSVVWRTSGDMSSNLLILEVGCCKLEDITISGPWRGMSGVSAIFRAASPQTMRTIAVDVTATVASEEFETFLQYLPTYTSLTTFTMTLVPSSESSHHTKGPAIIALLNNLPSMQRLRRFTLDFPHGSYTHASTALLRTLADIMPDLSGRLERLEIRIRILDLPDRSADYLWRRKPVPALLPPSFFEFHALWKRGILKVVMI